VFARGRQWFGERTVGGVSFLKQPGLYGYRRETLLRWVRFRISPLANVEKLEQLHALENGIQITIVKVDYERAGVDTPEDVGRVEQLLGGTRSTVSHA